MARRDRTANSASHSLNKARLVLAVMVMALAAGCSTAPKRSTERGAADVPVAPSQPAYTGAVYRAGHAMNLFLDRRARQVGDTITVTLVERTDASKASSTSTSKDSNISIPAPTLLGRGVTHNGVPILQTDVESAQAFDGEGSSSQSNRLTGSVTVMVTEVLPNGNLRVRGEKWVTINQGEEFIRLTGIVRPEDIAADNSIPSFKVADARIAYSAEGALADANRMGWLGRIFQSVFSPF